MEPNYRQKHRVEQDKINYGETQVTKSETNRLLAKKIITDDNRHKGSKFIKQKIKVIDDGKVN